jgi:hypothetical protein
MRPWVASQAPQKNFLMAIKQVLIVLKNKPRHTSSHQNLKDVRNYSIVSWVLWSESGPANILTLPAEHWWLTPVILATPEAEIRRISGQSQAGANTWQDSTSKKPITKRIGGVAQVVECLPSEHEALSSNRCTTKKNHFNITPTSVTLVFFHLELNFCCFHPRQI